MLIVKALILAGGSGTRGRPYTEYIPKAMIPVDDRPLVDYVIGHIRKFDTIDEIIIVSNFEGIGRQMKNYLQNSGVTLIQDSQSGTGGDLLHAAERLDKTGEFLLWFADNLCALNIDAMLSHYKRKKSMACVATRTRRKEETGFATVRDGMVGHFTEKPEITLPMAECLGIYILSTKLLEIIRSMEKSVNLSYDVLQDLAQRKSVSAYDIGGVEWIDVESPAVLERNRSRVYKIIRQMA